MHTLFSFINGIYHYHNYTSLGRQGVRTEILISLKAPIVKFAGAPSLRDPHMPLPDQSLLSIDSVSTNNPAQPAALELGQGGLRLSPALQERLIYTSSLILALWDTERQSTSPDRRMSAHVYLLPDWTQERGAERASELML